MHLRRNFGKRSSPRKQTSQAEGPVPKEPRISSQCERARKPSARRQGNERGQRRHPAQDRSPPSSAALARPARRQRNDAGTRHGSAACPVGASQAPDRGLACPGAAHARTQGLSARRAVGPQGPGAFRRRKKEKPLEGAFGCRNALHEQNGLSSHGLHRSTFGDGELNCRVRYGIG